MAVAVLAERPRNHNLSVIKALTWIIWHQNWPWFALIAGYIACTSLVLHFVTIPIPLFALFGFPLEILLIWTFMSLAKIDSHPFEKSSDYSPFLLKSPVDVKTLVFWPMLLSSVAILVLTLFFYEAIIVPEHWHMYLFTVLTPFAMCFWMQAAYWSPIGTGQMRAFVMMFPMMLVLFAFGGGAAYVVMHLAKQSVVSITLVVLTVLAYPSAVAGLRSTRCGQRLFTRDISGSARALTTFLFQTQLPRNKFGSGFQAQKWIEWSAKGLAFSMICWCFMMMCVEVAWLINTSGMLEFVLHPTSPTISDVDVYSIALVPLWRFYLPQWLFIPQFASLFLFLILVVAEGKGFIDTNISRQSNSYLRPLTSLQIINAKLRVAARSALVLLVFFATAMLVKAKYGPQVGPLWFVLLHVTSIIWFRFFLAAFVLLYFAWKLLADTQITDYAGKRRWLSAVTLLGSAPKLLLVAFAIFRAWGHPFLMDIVIAIVLAMAISKMVALGWLAGFQIQNGLMQALTARNIAFVWLGAMAVATGLAIFVLPVTPTAWWIVASWVVLFMPGIRIAAAPIALEHDRHQ